MSVQVSFIYDEDARRWQTLVSGPVRDAREAIQALTSVVMTCQQLNPVVLSMSKAKRVVATDGRIVYSITPAIES